MKSPENELNNSIELHKCLLFKFDLANSQNCYRFLEILKS